jgi:ubiquinone/menaquinone biosynthesis C-methylase UbiE
MAMNDHREYNDKLFSRWAPVYDGFEIILCDVRKKMTREINPKNKSVLDVATGTGSLAIALSDQADKVTGIDLSSKMLDVARKKRSKDNLSFLQMDAGKMNFQDNEFDIVTISLGLHDMPPGIRTCVLEEVKRVLKKDGKLYILEYDLPPNKFLGWCTSHLVNIYESKYYLEFINSDFVEYLNELGFRVESKTNYLFRLLQSLTLTYNTPAPNIR